MNFASAMPNMGMPAAAPPPPPPPPAFNPLPPTMKFAVLPPRPAGLPANFSMNGGSPHSASRAGAKKRKSSQKSKRPAVVGARIVTAAARLETSIEYKAPTSLKLESLSNLKMVAPEEVRNLKKDKADCAICLCELVEDEHQGQTRRERRAAMLAQLPCG